VTLYVAFGPVESMWSPLPMRALIRRKDEDHLSLATAHARVLYSFNIRDYHEIHTEWTTSGRSHAGIILAQQKRYSIGEQIRRLVRLIGSMTDEAMRNREEFLGRW
jgi:hypothetical protein